MSGQLKGGHRFVERLGHFATCVMSVQDRTVYNKVLKAVVARP